MFDVVYEDDDVIVVDKPAGLVVHPGAGHDGSTLVNGLLARSPGAGRAGGDPARPGIVHRLDKGTSGLLVVARTDDARDELISQLATHSVDRHYAALTWGHFETPSGIIDAPVGRSRRDPLRMTVQADGRPARTHYEVQRRLRGAPGDAVGVPARDGPDPPDPGAPPLHRAIRWSATTSTAASAASSRTTRPFLHAKRLRFDHPRTTEPMTFESPLPDDLTSILAGLA